MRFSSRGNPRDGNKQTPAGSDRNCNPPFHPAAALPRVCQRQWSAVDLTFDLPLSGVLAPESTQTTASGMLDALHQRQCTAHAVGLPARGLDQLGECGALRALEQRDHRRRLSVFPGAALCALGPRRRRLFPAEGREARLGEHMMLALLWDQAPVEQAREPMYRPPRSAAGSSIHKEVHGGKRGFRGGPINLVYLKQ